MSYRFKLIFVVVLVSISILLIAMFNDIKQTYITLGNVTEKLDRIEREFTNYQSLVKTVNEIDSKFTRELIDERDKNNDLYLNVINGIGRLQLNIEKTTTTGMDDEKSCQLNGEARQNYYLLRNDIITKDKMILGLQEYINEICLNN